MRLKIVLNLVLFFYWTINPATYPFNTISVPGFYKLAANVSGQIIISTSDVTLDLQGHTVSGGANGIVINSNLSNVTIKNGKVNNVTTDGIQVGAGCSDILLKDVSILSALRGVHIDNVTNALIRNCDLTGNTIGLEIDTSHNIYVENCTANANVQAGYSVVSSTTCSFFDCKAISTGQGNSNSSGDESFVYGFVSRDGNGHIFERCIANGTENLSATNFNTVVAGMALLGTGTQCHKIIECEVGSTSTDPDGVTAPYGIYLQPTLAAGLKTTVNAGGRTFATKWSPDGKYIAVGMESTGGDDIELWEYDRENNELVFLDGIDIGAAAFSGSWSPDGGYIAYAAAPLLRIYKFDRENERFGNLISATGGIGINWHPSGKYIAVGNNNVLIYQFDKEAETLTLLTTVNTGGRQIEVIRWHPINHNIFAIGYGDASTPSIGIYRFNPGANTTTLLSENSDLTGIEAAQTINWSPCGNYLVGGGGGNTVRVFSFDGNDLTSVATYNYGAIIEEVQFAPDGRYIAVAGRATNEFQILFFDRNPTPSLSQVFGADIGDFGEELNWSPDGEFIVVGSDNDQGTPVSVSIFSAYEFPSGNVIQNNKVYCNFTNTAQCGGGISGSSIRNMITGNSSYSNALNYIFVTNQFNQLFGQGPSTIQDIGAKNKEAICMPDDIPTRIKRTELLLESLIDNLL